MNEQPGLRDRPAEAGTLALRTDRLCAGYHGVPVVHDLDLSVRSGELVALFGPNGAGKTTTLLALAGELKLLGGTVSSLDEPMDMPLHVRAKRGWGLLTEDRAVFFSLSVRDNLRLGRGSVEAALSFFPELDAHLNRRAGLLSGGQQQMLALARILAAEPAVILADELSLGLAPLIARRLLRALREAAERGAAVLLVEQQVRVALKEIDRAYVLTRGRIALEATAGELRRTPHLVTDQYFVQVGEDA